MSNVVNQIPDILTVKILQYTLIFCKNIFYKNDKGKNILKFDNILRLEIREYLFYILYSMEMFSVIKLSKIVQHPA